MMRVRLVCSNAMCSLICCSIDQDHHSCARVTNERPMMMMIVRAARQARYPGVHVSLYVCFMSSASQTIIIIIINRSVRWRWQVSVEDTPGMAAIAFDHISFPPPVTSFDRANICERWLMFLPTKDLLITNGISRSIHRYLTFNELDLEEKCIDINRVCMLKCAFVYHSFFPVDIHRSISIDWQLIDAYSCLIVWRKHRKNRTSISRDRMRHATSSSEKTEARESMASLFVLVITHLLLFSACWRYNWHVSSSGVCILARRSRAWSSFITHKSLLFLLRLTVGEREKEKMRERKKERKNRERERESQEKLSFIYSLTL